MLEKLKIAKYRFALEALEELHLPPYKGSTLRGGFGSVFKRTVCFQREVRSCNGCLLKANCPYAYIFETPAPPDAEAFDVSEAPHPFVVEPPLDDRTVYRPGELLPFNLILVGRGINYLPYFIVVFRELGKKGLGRERGRFRLQGVEAVHPLTGERASIYSAEDELVCDHDLSVGYRELEGAAGKLPQGRLSLHFLTPTRLKHKGRYVSRPDFPILLRACLRRVSWLYYFHCGERWEADFQSLVEAAEGVETARMETSWVEWGRYSTRQRQRVGMGGFVGRAEYRGDASTGLSTGLGAFLPVVLLGSLVHVGKLCVFGHGRYEIC